MHFTTSAFQFMLLFRKTLKLLKNQQLYLFFLTSILSFLFMIKKLIKSTLF